jgi:signal transduction histidine kinase
MSPESAELSLPITFGEEHLGQLQVGSKRGGALFTTDDIDLLSTITNQGALALAHARAYQELEQRRRQQAEAWRGEREALVETVAAEIAHEIRYPINFFRSLFEHASEESLGAEDIDIGREEVERLERLVAGLRRMAAHRLQRRSILVRDLCGHAEVLLRDALEGRTLAVTGDPKLAIRCDADQITQVLVNLVANALQATQAGGEVGVRWTREGTGATLVVWDTGPGFVEDPATLFAPWYTTRERGTGLGLAITHRLVRAHGWTVQARRDRGQTLFAIEIRGGDVVREDDEEATETETEVA